jgi:hypothetical protein
MRGHALSGGPKNPKYIDISKKKIYIYIFISISLITIK